VKTDTIHTEYESRIVIIHQDNLKNAYLEAVKYGININTRFINTNGHEVQWNFMGITDYTPIYPGAHPQELDLETHYQPGEYTLQSWQKHIQTLKSEIKV